MWSEKYRPQIISDMVGNEEARAAITEWFVKWKKGTKPLLLVGPPGIGKTTIAYLVAKQFGYDMIGLNASDVRSKSRINEILMPVLANVRFPDWIIAFAICFLNILGNKFFSMVFSWLLEQPIKDTLCGTKVLFRKDYIKLTKNRSFFGNFDPFGDYDLLFGAYKLNLKIVVLS